MIFNALEFLFHFLFFATPLVMFSQTSELFEFNKLLVIYAVTPLATFLWILKLLKGEIKTVHKIILIPILLYFIVQCISTFFSIDLHTSIFGYYGRFNGGVLSFISYMLLSLIFATSLTWSSFKRVMFTSIVSAVIVVLWGIPGKFGYDLTCGLFTKQFTTSCWTDQFRPQERMFSTLGQPNWLGAFIGAVFFIQIPFVVQSVLLRTAVFRKKVISIGISLLFLFAIGATKSRSAILASGIGLFGLSIFFMFQKRFRIVILTLCMLLFLVTTGFGERLYELGSLKVKQFVSYSSTKKVENKAVVKSEVTDSFDIRKIVWTGAVELVKKYPFFGTGPETFAYAYYFVRPVEHNLTSEWDFIYNKAHNEFLHVLATMGFIGFGAYILLIISHLSVFIISYLNKKSFKDKLVVISYFFSYLTILITNFFGFSTTTSQLFFYFLPIGVFLFWKEGSKESFISLFQSISQIKKNVITGIAAILVTFSLYFTVTYFIADILYTQATNYYSSGMYQESALTLEKALSFKYEHVYEDKLSAALAYVALLYAEDKNATDTGSLIKASNAYSIDSLRASPLNVLYWRTRARNQYLYFEATKDISYLKQGVESLKQAERTAPTDPKIPYSLALYYGLLIDEEKKPTELEKLRFYQEESLINAIRLKPNYKEAVELKQNIQSRRGF